jgi:thiol:disulfide interchange protein DsbD
MMEPMRSFRWCFLGLWLMSAAAAALAGKTVATDNVEARLVSETTAIGPGQSIWVALEFKIRDGWHTYWRNPGDSGQATTLTWQLPAGFTAGDIVWPVPHRFELPPLVNYGYAKSAIHLVKLTAPSALKAGSTVVLKAQASWLVCADVCIPGDAHLELELPATATPAGIDPAAAALFAAARDELPAPAPAALRATLEAGQLVLSLGPGWGAALSQISALAFYPYADGLIDYGAPQVLTHAGDGLELTVKAGDRPPPGATIRGVLVATERSAGGPVDVPMDIEAGLVTAAPAKAPVAARALPGLPSLVLLAVLGGIILNLMPCVFPVLSIKAIGLVEQAKKHPAAVRAKGLVFAAGVVSSMLVLAVLLLVLRAGGEQIGWGFQLQSPLFVTLMVYLLLGVGLNLSGVFEVGGGLAGVGDGLTRGDSYHAAFFTGVLTTLVATPCTAPFMAAAVGAAITQSAGVALLIFASLGLGLSLPYLLLSFAPWLRRALPKPGAWMDTLKQIFAFPMYASAAWLLWVLAQQTSSLGLGAALAGAILVALAAWAYQKSKSSGSFGRVAAVVTAAGALAVAVLLPMRFAAVASTAAQRAATAGTHASADEWQPYDAAKLAAITAAGHPLLVNFTASWCLTCLVNERNAFADAVVQAELRAKGVTLMKGDWTNRDPAITQALSAFGRAGVPLYVVYNARPGSTEPLVLPQLLTANIVHAALEDVPDQKQPWNRP